MVDLELSVAEEIQDANMGRPHVVILGAGCSKAAFPTGDREGRRLPLMNDLIEVLGLEPLLRAANLVDPPENFEVLYSKLAGNDQCSGLLTSIEKAVTDYFLLMALPDNPTIYDHLLLSLRSKDCVATFNWDPFLWDAWERVQRLGLTPQPPKVCFLHGNVRIGICYQHKRYGPVRNRCPKCGQNFAPSRLLFPVEHKEYATDPFVQDQWNGLRRHLKDAYMLTIFGYGAPNSDAEAIRLMKEAWGSTSEKNFEQIEIVDIKSRDELAETWSDFIHTHHYQTSADFYDSWIAKHPRRTCEVMWKQLMECRFVNENPIPQRVGWLGLRTWIKPLIEAEMTSRKDLSLSERAVRTRTVSTTNQELDDAGIERLARYGAQLLKTFHDEYARDPVGRDTEFRRGRITEWRQLMNFIYGTGTAELIVRAARQEAGLTIPHAGPLLEDGTGYCGFDSGADTYVGKL